MTASANMRPKMVRISIDQGRTGLLYATSPDLRGLLVAEPTMAELRAAIPQAVTDLYSVLGVDVIVSEVEGPEGGDLPWVAFPLEIARKALASKADRESRGE